MVINNTIFSVINILEKWFPTFIKVQNEVVEVAGDTHPLVEVVRGID